MRNKLRRYYGLGHLHFITCSCYRRLPLLGTVRARNAFVKILGEVRDRYQFQLVGYVVMPEHVHLLIGEPARGTPSTVMQVLKQRVSRKLRRRRRKKTTGAQLPLRFGATQETPNSFWQRRFYDFNVWSARKVGEKLKYMHANPAQRRLVHHPKDWPWSSYLFYEQTVPVLININPVR